MKKLLSIILTIAMLAVTLTACGGTDSGNDDKSSTNSQESKIPVGKEEPATDTLVIYDTTGYELNNGSRVGEFKLLYPDVKVEVLACEDYTQRPDFDKKIMAEIMAGKGPDLIYISSAFFDVNKDAEKMMRSGVFADMTSFIENDKEFDYNY